MNRALWRLARELFLTPLWQRKADLGKVLVALLLMALAQGLFLLLVGPFLKILFQVQDVIPLAELLPPSLLAFWPGLGSMQVERVYLSAGVPLLLLLAGLVRALATYVYQFYQQVLAVFITKEYREELFAAVLRQEFSELERVSPARWMSVIMNDVTYLQMRFSDILSSFIKDLVLVFSCLLALVFIHWPTALILFFLTPVLAFFLGRTGKRISWFAETWQKKLAQLSAFTLDVRRRFNFIRAQNGEEFELRRFERLNLDYYRTIRRSIFVRAAFAPAVEFAGFLVFVAFLVLIGKGYWQLGLAPTDLIQFFAALGLLLRPLRNFGEQLARFHETMGSLRQSLELLNRDKASDPPNLPPVAKGSAVFHIDNLVCGHGGKAVMSAKDLQLLPGQAVAIVGPSGSGKSTLLKTLCGLLPPLAWQGKASWQELCQQTSFVSQTPFFFQDTIRNNLNYGLVREPTEKQVWEALRLVNMTETVESLPKGLDNSVRAITGNLSGGQLQRLVIARAMLRDKKIRLLDEATSAVDANTEKDIVLRSIAACHQLGFCLIAVTHRLSWLDNFDMIWFVEDGEIKFKGTHNNLLQNLRYSAFVGASQA